MEIKLTLIVITTDTGLIGHLIASMANVAGQAASSLSIIVERVEPKV